MRRDLPPEAPQKVDRNVGFSGEGVDVDEGGVRVGWSDHRFGVGEEEYPEGYGLFVPFSVLAAEVDPSSERPKDGAFAHGAFGAGADLFGVGKDCLGQSDVRAPSHCDETILIDHDKERDHFFHGRDG